MSGDPGPAEELADKTSQIVVAAANETWPARKVLLAVLPPTIALLIAVIGLWESSNRDRAAARDAEIERAVEFDREQAALAREQQLREAELVLPKYDELVIAVHDTRRAVDRCRRELTDWVVARNFDVRVLDDGTLVPGTEPPGRVDPLDPANLLPIEVDEGLVTVCDAIEPTIDPLGRSLARALLVSNPTLAGAAEELGDTLQDVSAQARTVLDKVDDETFVVLTDVSGTYFEDGTSTAAALVALNNVLVDIEPQLDDVIDAVRDIVLEFD